jgi:hypothetical protein
MSNARIDIFDLFKKNDQILFKLGVLTRALLYEVAVCKILFRVEISGNSIPLYETSPQESHLKNK